MQNYNFFYNRPNISSFFLLPGHISVSVLVHLPQKVFFQNKKHPKKKNNFQPPQVHICPTAHLHKYLYSKLAKNSIDLQRFTEHISLSSTCKKYQQTTLTFTTEYWLVNKKCPSPYLRRKKIFIVVFFFVYLKAIEKC